MQSRLKSKVVWVTILSAVVLVLQAVGVVDVSKADVLTQAGQAVLGALVVFGILNNPTDKEGF